MFNPLSRWYFQIEKNIHVIYWTVSALLALTIQKLTKICKKDIIRRLHTAPKQIAPTHDLSLATIFDFKTASNNFRALIIIISPLEFFFSISFLASIKKIMWSSKLLYSLSSSSSSSSSSLFQEHILLDMRRRNNRTNWFAFVFWKVKVTWGFFGVLVPILSNFLKFKPFFRRIFVTNLKRTQF